MYIQTLGQTGGCSTGNYVASLNGSVLTVGNTSTFNASDGSGSYTVTSANASLLPTSTMINVEGCVTGSNISVLSYTNAPTAVASTAITTLTTSKAKYIIGGLLITLVVVGIYLKKHHKLGGKRKRK